MTSPVTIRTDIYDDKRIKGAWGEARPFHIWGIEPLVT